MRRSNAVTTEIKALRRAKPEILKHSPLAFPHREIGGGPGQRVQSRCPGCGWGMLDSAWQYSTEDGAQTCRRCGYSSKLGHRRSLPNRTKVLSPLEAAARVDVSRRTIYTWIIAGWLRAHRVGGRWFVTHSDLDRFRKLTCGATGKPMPQLWQTELSELWANE